MYSREVSVSATPADTFVTRQRVSNCLPGTPWAIPWFIILEVISAIAPAGCSAARKDVLAREGGWDFGHLGRVRGGVGLDFGVCARPRGVYEVSWDRSLDTLGEHACAAQKV